MAIHVNVHPAYLPHWVKSSPVFTNAHTVRPCDWFSILVRRWCGVYGRCSGWCPVREPLCSNQTYLALAELLHLSLPTAELYPGKLAVCRVQLEFMV